MARMSEDAGIRKHCIVGHANKLSVQRPGQRKTVGPSRYLWQGEPTTDTGHLGRAILSWPQPSAGASRRATGSQGTFSS